MRQKCKSLLSFILQFPHWNKSTTESQAASSFKGTYDSKIRFSLHNPRLSGKVRPIALSLLSLPLMSMTAVQAEPLPCLESSPECVEQLTEAAIVNSSELKTLDDRIGLLDKRLGLAEEGINYAESKVWTNYLPDSGISFNPLDLVKPFDWIKNLLGGGDIQRERLAITDLEIKKADIEASRAELERQREVKKS